MLKVPSVSHSNFRHDVPHAEFFNTLMFLKNIESMVRVFQTQANNASHRAQEAWERLIEQETAPL